MLERKRMIYLDDRATVRQEERVVTYGGKKIR